jgi:hypothetical protein
VFPIQTLVTQGGNLPSEAHQDDIVKTRVFVALGSPAKGLDPQFSSPVYVDVGNIGTRQGVIKRNKRLA